MQDMATTQDGGVSNLAVGSFTGDGTICSVTTGFKPRYVKLVNLTDLTTYEWFYDLAATQSLKEIAAGTKTLDTTSAIVAKGGADGFRGFQIPAAVNIAAKVFHYIAFG